MISDLNFRQAATKKSIARFEKKRFALGSGDCARMTAVHLQNMGKPVVALNKVQSYTSLVGAIRALEKATGHKTLLDAMDEHFPAWQSPSRALLGDIVAMQSPHPIGAFMIYTGNGSGFGYSEEAEFPVYGRILKPVKAWRII